MNTKKFKDTSCENIICATQQLGEAIDNINTIITKNGDSIISSNKWFTKKKAQPYSNKSILIIDDSMLDTTVLMGMAMLQFEGIKIKTTNNYEDVIKRLEDNDYDAILLDMAMYPVSGLEIFKKLKEMELEYKTIIVTSYSKNHYMVKECMEDGAFGYLEKPIDDAYMKQVMGFLLSGSENLLKKHK